jgi:hypothetical protein
VPTYEVLFDYRLPHEVEQTRGAAFIAADSPDHAEQVLRTKSQFRRAAELKVCRLEEKPLGFVARWVERPSGSVLAWNVYPDRRTGRSGE